MHVCPWWLAYSFDNRLRRLLYRPEVLLKSYVRPGMTVLDLGCGMGFFSIAMAELTGQGGCVISVDLQQQMLKILMKRAGQVGVSSRIRPHCCSSNDIGNHPPVDFAIACYMLHEVPDQPRFLSQVRRLLKPGAHFFVMEPKFHVGKKAFADSLARAGEAGFSLVEQPTVRMSHAAVFETNA